MFVSALDFIEKTVFECLHVQFRWQGSRLCAFSGLGLAKPISQLHLEVVGEWRQCLLELRRVLVVATYRRAGTLLVREIVKKEKDRWIDLWEW